MTNTTLSSHLAALNSLTLAWVAEDPANRGACTYTEDLSYWNEIGVFTVEDFQRNELESTVWDLYKSVHGVRPRYMNFKDMSIDELKDIIKGLHDEAKWLEEMEAQWEAQQMLEDAWQAEADAHERFLNPNNELFWKNGCWNNPVAV